MSSHVLTGRTFFSLGIKGKIEAKKEHDTVVLDISDLEQIEEEGVFVKDQNVKKRKSLQNQVMICFCKIFALARDTL